MFKLGGAIENNNMAKQRIIEIGKATYLKVLKLHFYFQLGNI